MQINESLSSQLTLISCRVGGFRLEAQGVSPDSFVMVFSYCSENYRCTLSVNNLKGFGTTFSSVQNLNVGHLPSYKFRLEAERRKYRHCIREACMAAHADFVSDFRFLQ